MATFAVGDIHGHDDALEELLSKLAVELDAGDTVVFLGDYIDRGPSPKRCVERILTFRSSVAARVVALLGNHEDWLLRTLRDHTQHSWLLQMEAFDTIASYSKDAARVLSAAVASLGSRLISERVALPYDVFFDAIPAAHLAFFEGLVTHCRTPEGVFVHGGLDSAIRVLEDQPRDVLLWGTDGFPNDYRGPDTLVYGHWGNVRLDEVGWPVPAVVGKTIGIDSIAHGVLTAVRLPDRRVFQSGRSGSITPRS